jgi:hypothetical protein
MTTIDCLMETKFFFVFSYVLGHLIVKRKQKGSDKEREEASIPVTKVRLVNVFCFC